MEIGRNPELNDAEDQFQRIKKENHQYDFQVVHE